jgi:hypothetical protein
VTTGTIAKEQTIICLAIKDYGSAWPKVNASRRARRNAWDVWPGARASGTACKLTPEQEEFRLACEAQHVEHYVVHSADQAIKLVQKADGPWQGDS